MPQNKCVVSKQKTRLPIYLSARDNKANINSIEIHSYEDTELV